MPGKYNYILLLYVLIFFSCKTATQAQIYGDSLYVVAFNGVNLRASPSIASDIVFKVPFGTPLMYCSASLADRFELRNGHWIEVEYQDIAGYVFDGFLSDCPIQKSRKMSLTQLQGYIVNCYGDEVVQEIATKDAHETVYASGMKLVVRLGQRMHSWVYSLPNLKSRDLINIIDLAYSNWSSEDKTLIDHFKEDDFWKEIPQDALCPRAFYLQLGKDITLQYDYTAKSMDIDPVPTITILWHNR